MTKDSKKPDNKPNNNSGSKSPDRVDNKRIRYSRSPRFFLRENSSKVRIDSNDATIEQIESLLGNTGGNKKTDDNK